MLPSPAYQYVKRLRDVKCTANYHAVSKQRAGDQILIIFLARPFLLYYQSFETKMHLSLENKHKRRQRMEHTEIREASITMLM